MQLSKEEPFVNCRASHTTFSCVFCYLETGYQKIEK